MWRNIDTYKKPIEFAAFGGECLLYDPEVGIRIGYGFNYDGEIEFFYDSNGYRFRPTHWMPLPDKPEKE